MSGFCVCVCFLFGVVASFFGGEAGQIRCLFVCLFRGPPKLGLVEKRSLVVC